MHRIRNFIKRASVSSLARNSAIVIAGSQLSNFGAYLYHLFVGRILGPEQYGELAALLSLFYILNVPSNALQTVLVKFFSVYKAHNNLSQAKGFFISATKVIFLAVIVVFVPLAFFFPWLTNFLHMTQVWNLVFLYLIFALFLIGTVNGSALQAFQKFSLLMIFANIGVYMRLLFGIGFSFFGVTWTLVGNVLSNALNYALTFIPLRFLLSTKAKPATISARSVAGYSGPTLLATLGIIMLYSQDVVLVKHYFSATTAGIYSSLSILGKVIFFASSALSFVLFPILAERKELRKPYSHLVFLTLGAVGALSLVLTAIYYFFPSVVVNLLFGEAYSDASALLGHFGAFISLYTLAYLLVSILLALGRTSVAVFTSIAAVSQIVLINKFHETLLSVIYVNMAVVGSLFIVLMVYYLYAQAKK